MFDLLRWLYDQAYRVYEFLGTLYYRIRDAALNAWNWAKDKANEAFWRAYDWVMYYYNRAVEGAQALVQGAIDIAYWVWGRAVQAAQDLIKIVEYKFWQALAVASQAARDLIKIAEYNLFKALAIASEAAQNLIKIVEYNVFKALNAASIAAQNLIDGLALKFAAFKADLGLDSPEFKAQLTSFLSNPLGWFVAYLMSVLLTILEVQVAYALGTEEATLPPPPDWNYGAAGGVIPGGQGAPPGASGLALPLDYLHQSGFGFRPGHWAIDFGCTTSMAVYACHSGKVVVAGWSNVGYGNYVIIQGSEWWSLYAHLSVLRVSTGQQVSASQPIGMCGCVGNSTCNHLHLELKHHGQYVDPAMVFGVGG